MEDHERFGNGPNIMANCKRSPGSPCSKSNNNNKEQDKFLPIANVGRIMKKVIPGNGKISKDAKETVQECVSEFISFITGEASDKCQREKRKTINGDDIIWAITTLGFDEYVEPLKQYLLKYRELEGDKSSAVNNVPKQQQQQQQQQQQYHDHQKQPIHHHHHLSNYDATATSSSVYSSPSATSLLSQPLPFMSADQPFPSPFPPNSIQTTQHIAALHQQDRFDSLGHW